MGVKAPTGLAFSMPPSLPLPPCLSLPHSLMAPPREKTDERRRMTPLLAGSD